MKAERTFGPITSFVIHLLIILALFKFVQFTTRDSDPSIQVTRAEIETVDLEEVDQELEKLEELTDIESEVFTDTPIDAPTPEVETVSEAANTDPMDNLAILETTSPLTMTGFTQRSDSGRASNISKYGGNARTERAVMKALEWLRINQDPNGSWGEKNQVGVTGLGLLAFLAHGELPSSEKYGPTVEKAIKYLLDKQDSTGKFKPSSHDYGHSVATYAISEAYAMTRIPTLRPAMDKGIDIIIEGAILTQESKGGSMEPVPGVDTEGPVSAAFWNYNYKQGDRHDLSFAGWQIQAMKAAKLAGCDHPKLDATLAKAANGVKVIQASNGRFPYTGRGNGTINMTGVAVLGLQLMGHGKTPEVQKGMEALAEVACDFDNPLGNPFYSWYYITQAKFHYGGGTWKSWNQEFQKSFVLGQNEDGSWNSPGGKEDSNGLAYPTSLGALTLMVYYRNLPTFQEKAVTEAAAVTVESEDDIEIGLDITI